MSDSTDVQKQLSEAQRQQEELTATAVQARRDLVCNLLLALAADIDDTATDTATVKALRECAFRIEHPEAWVED